MLTILGSTVINIYWFIYSIFFGGGFPIRPFNEHENLHFDHEFEDIHMNFKNDDESGHNLKIWIC